MRQEILHKRIKEKTWDMMEVHLRAINGINTNLIVYNYHLMKRSPEELRMYGIIEKKRVFCCLNFNIFLKNNF